MMMEEKPCGYELFLDMPKIQCANCHCWMIYIEWLAPLCFECRMNAEAEIE
jgi:hypothetical protein